jgi:hypothetical protein
VHSWSGPRENARTASFVSTRRDKSPGGIVINDDDLPGLFVCFVGNYKVSELKEGLE